MDPALRLHPGQQELTPAQEAEARRFAEVQIDAQLSTEPVDEQEAERLLRHAYAVARVPPPQQIHWVDGPLALLAKVALPSSRDIIDASVADNVWERVGACVGDYLWEHIGARVADSIWERVGACVEDSLWEGVSPSVQGRGWNSVRAYLEAPWLASWSFLDVYLAPTKVHALAHFNTMVSGYWLGSEEAVLVRRPRMLARDQEGRLHSATGKCLEYRDGWGFYAWHGVRVPEHVVLSPEALTREDYLREEDVKVRCVIQERMGNRLVSDLEAR